MDTNFDIVRMYGYEVTAKDFFVGKVILAQIFFTLSFI